MPTFKQLLSATAAAATLACVPIAPALAGGHGYGHFYPWGVGRGLVGAVVGLATLPLAIASAVLGASQAQPPYQSPGYQGPQGYAPPPVYYAAPPAYYPAPQSYYAPRPYYPRAPTYYPAPRTYYAPRAYNAPRSGYYGAPGSYRPGGYGYPRR